MQEIKRVSVCGAGIMGHGIAQVAAMHELHVLLMDVDRGALDAAHSHIENSLKKLAKKGRIESDGVATILRRIDLVTDLGAAVESADFIIEAVPEDLELKRKIFGAIDEAAPAQAILASNTSQFSITAIAAATKHPERVVGMHWFSPAVLMRLIEIVRGLETSDETLATTVDMARRLGKDPVLCRRDSPGFITTRLLAALTNEAQHIVEEGLATPEDVDKACRLAFGHPMGPFETADLTGLDTQLRAREALAKAHGDRFRPTNLLKTHVDAGRLGRKVGKGFYRYDPQDHS